MKPKHILFSLILAAALLVSACGGAAPTATQAPTQPPAQPTAAAQPTAGPIVIGDGLNRSVTLAKPAQRIVSMAPSITESLFAIGAGDQVVGRDDFSDFPEKAKSLPSIGGLEGKPNNEAIVALKPDLVIASELTPPEEVKALEGLGLTVFWLANPKTLDGMYQNLMILATLTGAEGETMKLVDGLKKRVAAVDDKVKTVKETPVVFYELDATDPQAPYTSGPGTFIDSLIKMAGGKNMGETLKKDFAQVSAEILLKENPDYILLGDATWGGVTAKDVAARPGWADLKAVKQNQVLPIDDNLISRPGPRMVDGLEALAKILHPDLFK
jgi:iron complex transport system substrate-binding protein